MHCGGHGVPLRDPTRGEEGRLCLGNRVPFRDEHGTARWYVPRVLVCMRVTEWLFVSLPWRACMRVTVRVCMCVCTTACFDAFLHVHATQTSNGIFLRQCRAVCRRVLFHLCAQLCVMYVAHARAYQAKENQRPSHESSIQSLLSTPELARLCVC